MKILNVIENIDEMTGGGATERTRQLGYHLSDLGHDVTVFPCCYIGTIFYLPNNMYDFVQVQNAIFNYGIENANLYHKSLEQIYNSDYFGIYENTWNMTNVRTGKLAYCAATCGENNPIDDIWTHSENERPNNFRD